MMPNIDKFQKKLGIKFKDRSLLIEALTHKSANKKKIMRNLNFWVIEL